ncbi:unnamed protein product, partial [Miscanthus lutarioriparius]
SAALSDPGGRGAGMARFEVNGKSVQGVDLLRRRHWASRLDFWPFLALYALWLLLAVPALDFTDALIVLAALSAAHILAFLFTAWSVDFRAFVGYSKVKDIRAANACKVTPAKFSGSKEIVPLHIQRVVASTSAAGETEEIYFDFRKQRFIFSAEKDNFFKLRYPTKELIGHYAKGTGYGTEAKIGTAVDKWGRNVFEYPQPTFQKLMKEQIMEPFLFSRWVKIPGTELLPGDIVSIGRSTSGEDRSVPADMLLLAGSAIINEAILTGESTPQWKVSIAGRGPEDMLSIKRDKNHILFGGTKVLQHTADKSVILRAPDGGCLAFVLRTGFETSQGKLMRTILFSTERVTANNKESGLFILFFALLCNYCVRLCAYEAVNTSLIALARRGIFCTEPFRIPFAGKVDICCFDKTGTLTSDDMEFQGIVTLEGDDELISDANKLPLRTQEVLSSCHALVFVDNKLVGDPLEKAAIKGIDWIYTSDEKAMSKKPGGQPVQIVHRYHFASHLKRMSVIVRIQEKFYAFIKGAPETIQERLVDLPAAYVETYKKYTRQGSRVLALAYKLLPEMPVSEARSLERDQVESDLTFAGFAVFNCPIRSDSGAVLQELGQSSHDLVMITGDQALTACHVASQVHISSKPVLILTRIKTGGFEWVSPDETDRAPYSAVEVAVLSESHDLCINGDCFEMLQSTEAVLQVIPYVKNVIEHSLHSLKRWLILMLEVWHIWKKFKPVTAHVGIALLNAQPVQKVDSKSKAENKSGKLKKQKPANEASSQVTPAANSSAKASSSRPMTAAERQREKLQKMLDEMNDESDGRSAPIVKLGDASMASPFTAKHASVAPTLDIIRQGRSTLVTTLQMFKILGLNCLATAYVLSVMYLDGVKLGDVQATISGVFTAAFFLFISHARPLQTLSAERPHPNIFCAYVLLSILGQFAMHIFFLITAVNEASKHMPEECIEPDSGFHPNLVNTVSYMVNMMIQVATFAVNYMGHPFNQSISENKPFKYALYGAVAFFTVITSDMFRDLNDYMKLEPLPEGMRGKLMLWAILMFCGCYGWERLLRWIFPGKMPAWEKRQKQAVANLEKKRD